MLESFNAKYASVDFIQDRYAKDLLQLQENMKCCLQITLGDPDDLLASLEMYIKLNIEPAYFKELELMVHDVVNEYKKTLNKVSHRRIYIMSKQVPDEDLVKIGLKQVKADKKIKEYSLLVKGGYKIDFSSGVFVSGIPSTDFILQQFNFSYRESKDTVVLINGAPHDSIIYSGNVAHTTGNFIRRNENKVSYMAGMFAHMYRRSGHAFNWGAGVGFSINTEGRPYVMAGLSAMLNSGATRRICLIAGIIGGKEKTLAGSASGFEANKDLEAHDNSAIIYENAHKLPRYYDTGKDLSVDVYDKFKVSWFVGLSFNLGSFSIK